MKFNLNNFLIAVSMALDFVEMDILGATANHTRRVAYISLRIAEKFELTIEETFDLCSFAILHDNGLSEEVLHSSLQIDKIDRLGRMEGYKEHCNIGERNIEGYPFLTENRDIVRYHHENFNGTGFFGMKSEEIPLMAQIVAIADYIDNRFHFEIPPIEHRKKIIEYVKNQKSKRFSDDIVDAFFEVSSQTRFWFDLREPFIEKELPLLVPPIERDFGCDEVLKITSVFSRIIDSKSKFTARHSTGLIEKAKVMADFYGFSTEKKKRFAIAASLHDLGKLAIPNRILDNRHTLSMDDFEIVKSHTYFTRKALQQITCFDDITEWASNHHEKLNGAGYPYGFDAEKLSFEDRLMGCLDIYQALTEQRPYRNPSPHKEVMILMKKMVKNGYIDGDIVANMDRVFA